MFLLLVQGMLGPWFWTPYRYDGAVPSIDSRMGVASSVVICKALNWLIVFFFFDK